MAQAICRWGILGTAGIARKNWLAMRNAENCTLSAVASRDIERCRRFIAECQRHAPFDPPPRACGSYEELLPATRWMPCTSPCRPAFARRGSSARPRRESTCWPRSPSAATAGDVREILAACRRGGVQFMDGVMFMHSRRLGRILEVLGDGQSVGQLRRIDSQFSFCDPPEFSRATSAPTAGWSRWVAWATWAGTASASPCACSTGNCRRALSAIGCPATAAGQAGGGPDRVLGRVVLS